MTEGYRVGDVHDAPTFHKLERMPQSIRTHQRLYGGPTLTGPAPDETEEECAARIEGNKPFWALYNKLEAEAKERQRVNSIWLAASKAGKL